MIATEQLDKIPADSLAAICRRIAGLTRRQTRSRELTYVAIGSLPEYVQQKIQLAVSEAVANGETKYQRKRKESTRTGPGTSRALSKKHKAMHASTADAENVEQENQPVNGNVTEQEPEERGNLEGVDICSETPVTTPCETEQEIAERIITSDFLRAPTQEELDNVAAHFIEVTSNKAMETGPCGSCARETPNQDLISESLENAGYQELLRPASTHPAHVLTNGMLLYEGAVDMTNKQFKICLECVTGLKNNKQPKHSLANDMWIGDVPRELKGLTLPERILIAKYYPAAYIIKLYPKQKGAKKWDTAQMHNGLKGNVSTYKLDPKQVVSMIDGTSYPPTPRILSATIGVTFLGPKGLPETTMPEMFRVRRRRVKEALLWLKTNNPLYVDITISEENLDALPDDGVPPEIMLVVKYSGDVMAAEREGAGYVPDDAGDEGKIEAIL